MKINEYIKKIQNLPLIKRKVIFWSVIIIFGLILLAFWIRSSRRAIEGFQKERFLEQVRWPALKQGLEDNPYLNQKEK
jgi:hypothetical protein